MSEVDQILAKACFFASVKTDTELSEFLRIPYKTLTGWKTRGHIPEKRITQIALALGIRRDVLVSDNKEREMPHSCDSLRGVRDSKPASKIKLPIDLIRYWLAKEQEEIAKLRSAIAQLESGLKYARADALDSEHKIFLARRALGVYDDDLKDVSNEGIKAKLIEAYNLLNPRNPIEKILASLCKE